MDPRSLNISILVKSTHRSVLLLVLFAIASCQVRDNATVSGLPVIEESDSLNQALAEGHFARALKFSTQDKDSALIHYLESLRYRETMRAPDERLVRIYTAIGKWYYNEYKFEEADKFFSKAHVLSDSLPSPLRERSSINLYLASCKRELKDLPSAKSIAMNVMSELESSVTSEDSLLAKCYDLLSSVEYVNKNYDEAINLLQREIDLNPPDDLRELGRLYSNQSIIYLSKNQFSRALQTLDKAMRYDLRQYGPLSSQMASRYRNKGMILKQFGNLDSSRFYYIKSLDIRRKLYGTKHANTFGALYTLGNLNIELGRLDSALYYFQHSLISLVRNFDAENWRLNPNPTAVECNKDLTLALVAKARCLEQLGHDENSDEKLLTALDSYILADSIFSLVRKGGRFDDTQFSQLEEKIIPYDEIIALGFYLHDRKGDLNFLDVSFKMMEQSRSIVLQEAFFKAHLVDRLTETYRFMDEESQISKARSSVLLKLANADVSPKDADSLNIQLLNLDDDQLRLQQEIEKVAPHYYQLNYKPSNSDLADMVALAQREDCSFIEYHWAESNIYAMVINGEGVTKKTIPLTDEFRRAFDFVAHSITSANAYRYDQEHFRKFCDYAFLLFQALVGDLLKDFASRPSKLVICPGGPLTMLPFECLITNNPKTSAVNYNLPYVLHHFEVTYAHSLGLYKFQNDVPRKGNSLLGFSFGDNDSIQASNQYLPGTVRELNAIDRVWDDHEREFYVETGAHESQFKQRVSNYNLLHLALHGVSDSVNALKSRLIFFPSRDSAEDGLLYAHELYDLRLANLDLVVLSACESGSGKFQTGEGQMSIARGFAFSGCPSVVMSLWKIPDSRTALLMEHFYGHLARGAGIGEALKSAKVEYLSQSDELGSHPSNWAAFIQMGNTRPVGRERFTKQTVLFAMLIIAGSAYALTRQKVLYFFRRKKKDP